MTLTAWGRAPVAAITAVLMLSGMVLADAEAATVSEAPDAAAEPEDLPDEPAPQIGDALSPAALRDLQTMADETEHIA